MRFAGRSRRTWHVAAVVGAALIWSTSFAATKVALAELPPLTIGALRFSLAAVLLGVAVAAWGSFVRPTPADLGRLALGGLLGTTIYFSMENVGVDLATASDAALLVASYPAITMGLEILLYRERASWIRFLGVGLAMAGVYLIVGGGAFVGGKDRILGDLILLAAGVVWAFYSFSTRKINGTYQNTTVVFYQTAAGAVAFAPLALAESGRWQMPSAGSALIVAYLGIFCSVLAFLSYAYGLKGLSSGSAVNLLNLVPVFGVGFAFLLLGEPVGVSQLVGGAVVVSGVVLSLRSKGDEAAFGEPDPRNGVEAPEAHKSRPQSSGGEETA